ncbi:hypothetical protein K438DRAFT_1852231 [Mycena galopus ATCC 62051]|nr:hypothetical protein K438DRAFT_1852231 [Mycena galopus ATCC 62051]
MCSHSQLTYKWVNSVSVVHPDQLLKSSFLCHLFCIHSPMVLASAARDCDWRQWY